LFNAAMYSADTVSCCHWAVICDCY